MSEQNNCDTEIDFPMDGTKASVVRRMGLYMQEKDALLEKYKLDEHQILRVTKNVTDGKPPFLVRVAMKILKGYGAIIDTSFRHKDYGNDKLSGTNGGQRGGDSR